MYCVLKEDNSNWVSGYRIAVGEDIITVADILEINNVTKVSVARYGVSEISYMLYN